MASWVQGGSGHVNTGSPSVTLAKPVGFGNCLLVAAYTAALSFVGSVSLTDDKGNVYKISDQGNDTTNGNSFTIFYLSNITNGPTVLSLGTGIGTDWQTSVVADEFFGVSTASDPRDGHVLAVGTQSAGTDGVTSGNITTTANGEIIWSAVLESASLSPDSTSGTGFTPLESDAFGTQTEYLIKSTAGTVAGTWTHGATSDLFFVSVMALKNLVPFPISMADNEC
jgi:hypothetical protein